MSIELKWNKPLAQIANEAVGGDKTALFAANTWHKLIDPFTPMDTGTMAHDAVETYTEDGNGIIHYKAPYANRQFNGDGFNFSAEKHPLASAHWDEAAKQAGKAKELTAATQAFIKRGF